MDPVPDSQTSADPCGVVDPHWFSQTSADPCGAVPDPGQTLKSQKVEIYMKNTLKVGTGNRSRTYLRRYKSLFEMQETRFIC
jgi:hypothetical protein